MASSSSDDNNTFVRITNTDIYNEIQSIKDMLATYEKKNSGEHDGIRGQLGIHNWMILGCISISVAGITWFVSHLMGGN